MALYPEPNKKVKLDSEVLSILAELRILGELRTLIELLHNDLRSRTDYNNGAIYNSIQALHNIDPAIPLVEDHNPIDLDNYPNLATIILDSVRNEGRNEGRNLIINENNLTVNSTNLILQGILDGLNATNPQFQELESLQISSNELDGENAAMNEQSMNLLSTILLHPHSLITDLDIGNNNINPDHLNILLRNIAANPGLTANLQELNFSLNFINQDSVPLLNTILGNQNIMIIGVHSIPRDVLLGDLEHNPRVNLTPGFEPAPANIISGSGATSLYSTFNSNAPAA